MPNLCYMKNNTKCSCQMYEKPLGEIDPKAAEGVVGYIRYFSQPGLDEAKKYYLPLVLPTDSRASDLRILRSGQIVSPLRSNYVIGNKWVTLIDAKDYDMSHMPNPNDLKFHFNSKVRDRNDINGSNVYIWFGSNSCITNASTGVRGNCRADGVDSTLVSLYLGPVWPWDDLPETYKYFAVKDDDVSIFLSLVINSGVKLTVKYLIKE